MWRRRYCEKCGRTFTTRENVELGFLEVLTLNGSKEPFSRSKLIYSIIDACSHMPDRVDASGALTETAERDIARSLSAEQNTITSSEIAAIVSEILKKYDPLAYLKYVGFRAKSPTSKRELKSLIKESN